MSDDEKLATDAPRTDVMEQLFPVDPDSWNSRLLNLPKRTVERMRTGSSRMPPAIVQKLKRQVAIRNAMLAEIESAIAKAEKAGGHSLVLRYGLNSVAKSNRLSRDDEPL